jgi:hypothetical protein
MSTGEESDQVAQRRANLEELKKLGVEAEVVALRPGETLS